MLVILVMIVVYGIIIFYKFLFFNTIYYFIILLQWLINIYFSECPRGDDPGTYDDHVEVQLLQCIADGGTFQLGFRQEVTESIAFDVEAAVIEAALEKLSTLSDLTVSYSTGSHACSTDGSVIISVEFATTHSDLPALKIFKDNLSDNTNQNGNLGTGVINIAVDGQQIGLLSSIKGTTENAYCNNRGMFLFHFILFILFFYI